MIRDIRPVQQRLERAFDEQQKHVDAGALRLYQESPDKAVSFLTTYCADAANGTTARWKKLGEYLLVKYMDGNEKKEKDGRFVDNGYGLSEMPNFPGYSKEFYEWIVKTDGERLQVRGPKDEH